MTGMDQRAHPKDWVYVVVCEEGESSHFLGLYNKEEDVNFIPTFKSRDDANDCFLNLPREKGKKYEIQAIHLEELTADAQRNGFVVAFVDGDGTLIK